MSHLSDFQINELLDGLGDPATRRHLETCAECRARLDDLQLIFASLEALPEIRLARDLTPNILAKLPQKPAIRLWSPWLAAQWGSLAGVLAWLSFETAKVVSRFDLHSLAFKVQAPDLSHLVPNLKFLTFDLQLSTFPMPTMPLSTYHLPLTPEAIILLGLSASLLWVVGNVTLLRDRPRVRA